MKLWNKFIRGSVSLFTLAWIISFGGMSHAKVLDKVIAKVNDDIITLSEVQERTLVEMGRLKATGNNPNPNPDEIMERMLERMIEDYLILDQGKKLGVIISDERVLAALDEIKSNNNISDEQLLEILKGESQTMAEYKENIRDQILLSRVVSIEIKNRIIVTEKDIKKYYEKNKKEYWKPGKVRASHILFILDKSISDAEKNEKEVKAEMVLNEIRSGKDFFQMAKAYSEDISASTGGDLGELERGKIVPELERVVFSMEEGEVSGIIRSPYGLHIIKVTEVSQGRTLPLEEVRDKIVNAQRLKRFKKSYESYMVNLKKNAFIESYLKKEIESRSNDSVVVKNKPKKRPREKQDFANILPPLNWDSDSKSSPLDLEVSDPTFLTENTKKAEAPAGHKLLENELMDLKNLMEVGIISEDEYQKGKREILEGL